MASEHFFSWPGDTSNLGQGPRMRVGLRMMAAGAVILFGPWLVLPIFTSLIAYGAGVAFSLIALCTSIVGLVYLLRGFVTLMRGLFSEAPPPPPPGEAPAAATAPAPRAVEPVSLSSPEPAASPAPATPVPAAAPAGAGSNILVWLLGTVVVLGLLAAWLMREFDKGAQRAKLSEGIISASALRLQITEAFEAQGPRDMSCSAARCMLGALPIERATGVKEMASDRTGAITIDFEFSFLPQGQRRVTLVPMIGGQVADLSQPAAAGRTFSWHCDRARTTVPPAWVPAGCR